MNDCTHSERRKGICMRCGKDFNPVPVVAERTPRQPKLRPFTAAQFRKWVDGYKGWGSQIEADGGCSAEDAVVDFAEGLIAFPDPETKRAIAHLTEHEGVRDVKGCLADHLFDVAHK